MNRRALIQTLLVGIGSVRATARQTRDAFALTQNAVLDFHLWMRLVAGNHITSTYDSWALQEGIRLYNETANGFPTNVSGLSTEFAVDNRNIAEVREHYWKVVDAAVARLSTIEDIERGLLRLPSSITSRQSVDIRDNVMRAIADGVVDYSRLIRPVHDRSFQAAEHTWRRLLPTKDRILARIESLLQFSPHPLNDLVFVGVGHAPPPGSAMYVVPRPDGNGRPITGHTVVLGTVARKADDLLEATIRELILRYDDVQRNTSGTLMNQLRRASTTSNADLRRQRHARSLLVRFATTDILREQFGLQTSRVHEPAEDDATEKAYAAWTQYTRREISASGLVLKLVDNIRY